MLVQLGTALVNADRVKIVTKIGDNEFKVVFDDGDSITIVEVTYGQLEDLVSIARGW